MYGNWNYVGTDLDKVNRVCTTGKVVHIDKNDLRLKVPVITKPDGSRVYVTGNSQPLVLKLNKNLNKTPRGWFVAVRHAPLNTAYENDGYFLYDLHRICNADNNYYYTAEEPFPPLMVALIFMDKQTGGRIGVDARGYPVYFMGTSQWPLHSFQTLFEAPDHSIRWILGYKQGLSKWGRRAVGAGVIVGVVVATVFTGGAAGFAFAPGAGVGVTTTTTAGGFAGGTAGVSGMFGTLWSSLAALGTAVGGVFGGTKKDSKLGKEQQQNITNTKKDAGNVPATYMDTLKTTANAKWNLINEYITDPTKRAEILATITDPDQRAAFLKAVADRIQKNADMKVQSNMANIFVGLGIGGIALGLLRLYMSR